MTDNTADALDILDKDIDFDADSSSDDLVGANTQETEPVDMGDINDLMKEDEDADVADLNEIDNLLTAAKSLSGSENTSDNFSELDEPKEKETTKEKLTIDTKGVNEAEETEKKKFISNSPTSLTYKAEGKSWPTVERNVEVTEESSEGSSIVKLEKPNENDVQSIDDTSSSPTKSNEKPKSAESTPTKPLESVKEADTISLNQDSKEETNEKEEPSPKKVETISEDISKFIVPSQDIVQLQNLHTSEKLKLEQELRRIKNENDILQTRLTTTERALKGREQSTADLVKQISKLTREKKAYEDQVRFFRNKANNMEKEINDSVAEKQEQMRQELEMSNKKLALMKTGHKRKTTEMEIQMRRLEEKQSAMKEEHELPTEVTELHDLTMNLKLELRMKDAEMKVLQERLTEYKSQIRFKDVAENLTQEILDMKDEVALVHESKKQIIRTLTAEIEELRSTMVAYINRPSTEDLRSGIIKGYHFSRTTAEKVYTKIFAPPPSQPPPQRDDRNAKSWG